MLRVDPRDEADLLWVFNQAEGEIKNVRSTWPDEARGRVERIGTHVGYERIEDRTYLKTGLWCGAVEVKPQKPQPPAYTIDGRALAAASKESRIRRALRAAGPEAELVLRLRFREVLAVGRLAFGCAGAGHGERSGRTGAVSIGRVETLLRGPGAVAHLTDAAREAWGASRTTLEIGRWTDRLGQKLASGGASEAERTLQREVSRQAEAMVLRAYQKYRGGSGRVPEIVRRRAFQHQPRCAA